MLAVQNKGKGKKSRRGGKQRQDKGSVVSVQFSSATTDYLARTLGGVPQTQRQTLIFATMTQSPTSAGTYGEQTVTLNSPLAPGGSVAAVGYAKMMAFYSKCFVLRCRWRTDVQSSVANGGIPGSNPYVVGATVTTTSASLTTQNAAIEAGLSQYGFIGYSPDHRTFEGSIDIGRYLNKPDILDDDQLYATASVNPTSLVFLHSWFQNWGPAAGNLNTLWLLEFDCVFTDPIVFT
jgi:hypothetical protein